MNDEVTKLFDRSFLVGFFAPALYFVVSSIFAFYCFEIPLPCVTITSTEPLKNATLIAGVAMALAIFLMSLNREIFRTAEGYWGSRLQGRLVRWERERFQKLNDQLAALKSEQKACTQQNQPFLRESELAELWMQLSSEFPDEEKFLLPTRFGNAVRSFEVYSRVMYGIDSIPAWPRLLAVMPKEFSELIGESRARVNFWLNIWLVSLVLVLEWVLLECCNPVPALIWFPGVSLLVLTFALRSATSSAKQHGEQVKAAFDVYLPELAKKVAAGSTPPSGQSRSFWTAYSQALIFRHPKSLARAEKIAKETSPAAEPVPGSANPATTNIPNEEDRPAATI